MNWQVLSDFLSALAVSTALNSIWMAALLTVLAATMLRLLGRPNAATRYAVWLTALLTASIAPVLILLVPHSSPAAVAAAEAPSPVAVPVTASWPLYLTIGWATISLILSARILWSIAYIHGLKRRATPLARRGGIRVLASREVRVPMAAGFFRRAIVFPQSVLEELEAAEFEQVLDHEMAHLRRWDDWTQLLQTVIEAVLFFN